MSDNEINLAVARACGYRIVPLDQPLVAGTNDSLFEVVWISKRDSGVSLFFDDSREFNPRNDDAQAIAALERYVGINGKWTIKRNANSLLIGFTHPVTRKWFQHMAWGEDERAKLSHAVTDAILAAQEKRNA